MAKKIGVIIDFLNDKYERQLNAAAAKYGYEIEYFPSSAEAVGRVDDCEILYGHCSQKVIRSAKSLKWYCCCWAGVDHFCDDGLYQNPDCLLSNSSGAYGTTISEHLIMVCLMLLRRQMEYTEIIRAGGWETLPGGIRSLHGARITVLGTGDIGTEFARRAQAFHPACITGVRRTVRSSDPAFTSIHAIAELDSVFDVSQAFQQFRDGDVHARFMHEMTIAFCRRRKPIGNGDIRLGCQFTKGRRFPAYEGNISPAQFIEPQYICFFSVLCHNPYLLLLYPSVYAKLSACYVYSTLFICKCQWPFLKSYVIPLLMVYYM